MRTRMSGGVGAEGSIPSATRLEVPLILSHLLEAARRERLDDSIKVGFGVREEGRVLVVIGVNHKRLRSGHKSKVQPVA
jgi:hypothetical protein